MVKTIKQKNESDAEMVSPSFDIVFSSPEIQTEAEQADIGAEFSERTGLPNTTLSPKSILKAEDNHDLSLGDDIVQFTELETISSKDVTGCAPRNLFQSATNSANSDFVEASFFEETIENQIPELDVREHVDCGQPSSNLKSDEFHQSSFGLEVTDLSDPTLNCVPGASYSNGVSSSMNVIQDNLFDVFNFDELAIGERTRRRSANMVGKALGDQDESYQTDFKECVLGGSIDEEIADEQYFLQAMATRDLVVTPTCIKPCGENHSPETARPHVNFQNQSFSDLLKLDELQLDNNNQQKSLFSRFMKKRDCSYSNDSGVGPSIMEFASSPTGQSPISSSCDSATVSPELALGNGCQITECMQRLPDPAETSVKHEGKLNKRNSAGKVSRECVVSTEEKVSSKKTAYNEKWGVKVLKAWCGEMSINQDFESLTPEKLNKLLSRFWSEVRKTNGDYYGRNSLFNLRAMINKHLKGKPFCSNFDIVTDERFRSSNDMLEKQLKILKGIGKTITHKEAISLDDLNRMYDSGVLGVDNPVALLRKVWFEITLHFCHKGSESQEKLTRRSFGIYHDEDYRAYVAKYGKGHDLDEMRMYETGGRFCPVQSFQLYLQKLHPQQGRLFQQPRRKSTASSPMWYGKAPIGEKALQQMMANISVSAKLSRRYTNHCVRTTAIGQFAKEKSHGRRAALVKPGHKFKISPPTIKEHTYCHSYLLQNVQQVGCYGNGSSSGVVPYTSQRSRQQEVRQAYPYEIYGHGIPSLPRHRNPFPQNSHDQMGAQLGPYRRAYKRSVSRVTSMPYCWNDGQSNYSNHQPSYNDPTQKRQRMENNSNFLNQIQVGNANSAATETYTHQSNANSSNNRVRFSETIIYDGGVPEVKSITDEEFSVLKRIE